MLAGHVLRETCPTCMRTGGVCRTCGGCGYVFRDLYDQRVSGEMRLDPDELTEPTPAFVSHDDQSSAGHQ